MSERLYLADLERMSEEQIKKHIADEYADKESGFHYGSPTDADKSEVAKTLENYDVMVAYEHVGSWGCDSSSFFILRNKMTGAFAHFQGGHCSCYGFEGQFDLEEMPNEFYHTRFSYCAGGYDDDSEQNMKLVKEWVANNIPREQPHE